MIGWFPTPYPDELVYSVCARYQEHAAYPSPRSVNEALFRSPSISPTIDLPCHLQRLVSALPPGHHITVKSLINDHTLLPFYSPFLPAKRVQRIQKEMRYGDGGKVHKLAGINNSLICVPHWLRFCPICVKEDRARFGTTYWHRIHQLSGIEVCADHAVFLANSKIRLRNRFDKYSYIPAEHSVVDSQARPLDLLNTGHSVQLNIARDAKWLLLHGKVPSNLKRMRARYLKLLSERGLAAMTGIVWIGKLLPAIKDHFTSQLLMVLQCDFDANKISSWPARLVKDISKGKVNHPLRHLLMMHFLGHQVESFFKLSIIDQTFGKALRPRYLNFNKPNKVEVCRHRCEWQQARKNNPKLSRSALIKKFPRLSYWLNRYDSQWFSVHLPRPRKTGGKTRSVNWPARDIELAKAVKAATNRLCETLDKPRRITKSLIGKEIDRTSLLDRYLHKLPRTQKVLEEVVETRVQFACRRIQWSADSFHEENVRPSRSALLQRAALDFNIWQEPSIKAATEAALNSFMEK
jgi:hypothetical protein